MSNDGQRGITIDRVARLEKFLQLDPQNPVLLRDLALAHRRGAQDKALELCAR